MFNKLADIWEVIRSDGGVRAVTLGKPRSVSSFRLVNALKDEGTSFQTIIDGGANVGQFARAASWGFPDATILSFEPQPEVVKTLRRNLAGVSHHKIFATALGSVDGEVEFHQCSYNQNSSVLPRQDYQGSLMQGTRELGTLRVPICKLDSVLGAADLVPPVLLKLDLQGYELEALEGAADTLTRTSHVLVETVFDRMYAGEPHLEEVWVYLRERGFRFVRPLAFLRDRRGIISQTDALFRAAE